MTGSFASYASPVDASAHGPYRPADRTVRRFTGRLSVDGSSGYPADPGRYHLYARWACPHSHRLAIIREMAGLADVVSLSYVDGLRDGRGWAFRAGTGPDPVNGFTLLRQAYEATQPGYHGEVAVPMLWDRHRLRVVSNEPVTMGTDLATAFRHHARAIDLYPAPSAAKIEQIGDEITAQVAAPAARAHLDRAAASVLRAALRRFDARLATRHRLLGTRLTDADIRLWVQIVRLDAGPNAHRTIGPRLDSYRQLWRWARELYDLPAFRSTTRFETFAAPLADLPAWQPGVTGSSARNGSSGRVISARPRIDDSAVIVKHPSGFAIRASPPNQPADAPSGTDVSGIASTGRMPFA